VSESTNGSRDCQIVRIEEDIQRNSTNTNRFFPDMVLFVMVLEGRTPLLNESSLVESSNHVSKLV